VASIVGILGDGVTVDGFKYIQSYKELPYEFKPLVHFKNYDTGYEIESGLKVITGILLKVKSDETLQTMEKVLMLYLEEIEKHLRSLRRDILLDYWIPREMELVSKESQTLPKLELVVVDSSEDDNSYDIGNTFVTLGVKCEEMIAI